MPWTKLTALTRIRDTGLVPIIRTPTGDEAMRAAEAILSSGIGIVEITLTVPNAYGIIERLSARHGDHALIGAGTIVEPAMVQAAVAAGARFLVTPAFDPRIIEAAIGAATLCISGAMTPTEVLTTWRAGADVVKVFPCAPLGGPAYIRALKGPLPQIEMVPTGGVRAESIPDFIRAGAAAVGIGLDAMAGSGSAEPRFDVIPNRLGEMLAAIRHARSGNS